MDNEKNLNQLQLDFISTVSHELRTPLTSIRGFAETLISSHDKLSAEQQIKFLYIIKDQANRLINLVENLLASSAQAESEQIFVLKPTNTALSIEKAVDIVKQKYPQKDIKIICTENLSPILADGEKFEQILINIIENACKYSFDNTIITVSTKETEANNVSIDISNDGQTIEDKDKTKIFEKFARLDSPMTRLTQGSGMGLYLALNMTKQMNGEIKLTSENNHTTFSIIMPIATPESQPQAKLRGQKND